MKKSKIIGLIVGVSMIVLSISMPIFAVEPNQKAELVQKVDYTEHKSAELDPRHVRVLGLFDDYRVYSDASWIVVNGVGVGAKGWTDIDEKSDGSNRYHYSNIQVYQGTQTWESGRKWGTGRVHVTTGNVGAGALSDYRLFYGF